MSDLLVDPVAETLLTVNTASGSTSLSVKNINGFSDTQRLLIGEPGNQGSEIVYISGAPSGSTITLGAATVFPHSASTKVYALYFDKVQILNAPTVDGTKTALTTVSLVADNEYTEYNDNVSTSGYYYAFFLSSVTKTITITRTGSTATATSSSHGYLTGNLLYISGANQAEYNGLFSITRVDANTFTFTVSGAPATPGTGTILAAPASPYSDPAPYGGYTTLAARTIIDAALDEINKTTSEVLTDEFAFQQIDNCQTECLRELKRWSFMQSFDQIIGNVSTGSWKVAIPADLDDENTNKSIYNIRIGTQQRLIWVDKEKFDEFMVGVAYSTLTTALSISDTTMILSDSSDFSATGTVVVGANSYDYTANDTTTGILTLSAAIASGTVASAGADVFQGVTQGLPRYFTVYGGYIFYSPITSSTYNGKNIYMDYYTKQIRIQHDSDEIVLPDPVLVQYYLQWKFLKKIANGEETAGSQTAMQNYLLRREKMKQKEVLGTTFKLRPRVQNFAQRSQFNQDTPRSIRDANFPNTGF